MSTPKEMYRDDRGQNSEPPSLPPFPRYASRVTGRADGDWKFHNSLAHAKSAITNSGFLKSPGPKEIWYLEDDNTWTRVQ